MCRLGSAPLETPGPGLRAGVPRGRRGMPPGTIPPASCPQQTLLPYPGQWVHNTSADPHPSNLFLNSLSFCKTSSSNLSTPYFSASLLCLTTLALNLSSSASLLPPAPRLVSFPREEEGFSPSLPACSSARARSVSMRRSWRARWESARSRRRVMKGVISERREDSAAERVGWGISS